MVLVNSLKLQSRIKMYLCVYAHIDLVSLINTRMERKKVANSTLIFGKFVWIQRFLYSTIFFVMEKNGLQAHRKYLFLLWKMLFLVLNNSKVLASLYYNKTFSCFWGPTVFHIPVRHIFGCSKSFVLKHSFRKSLSIFFFCYKLLHPNQHKLIKN